MKPVWKAVSWAGGVLGAAVTGAAVGVAAYGARGAARRRQADDTDFGRRPALAPSRESTVAADDGLPLSVEEVDPLDGGPAELTVVLVHGFALDRRCWQFQRASLAALTRPRVRQVLFDLRSHGRSGNASAESSTIEQLARDLDAVLRSVAPTGPLVLAGHSMGGMTIMALAEQRPELFGDRVRGVAFLSTSAGQIGQAGLPRMVLSRRNPVPLALGRLASLQPVLVEGARRAGGQIAWSLVRRLAFGDRSVDPTLVDLVDDMIDSTSVRVLTDFLETLGTHDRLRALAELRRCELLVLGGDADRLTPFSHSAAMAEQLPGATLVRVPGAGHVVMMEQADTVTGHLVELIRRCGPTSDTDGVDDEDGQAWQQQA